MKMRTDVILAVADALEAESLAKSAGIGFNMMVYYADNEGVPGAAAYFDHSSHQCGTVACIAGWTTLMFDETGEPRPMADKNHRYLVQSYDTFKSARRAMGLYEETAEDLFVPEMVQDWSLITPKVAAGVLRTLAETGEVKWPAELLEDTDETPEKEEI